MAKNSLRNLRDQLSEAFSLPDPDPALPNNWDDNWLFTDCKDSNLRIVTQGLFPRIGKEKAPTPKNTHPVFLLNRIPNLGYNSCPCSSQEYNSRAPFIPKGTQLAHSVSGRATDKNSYILESYTFKIVANNIVVSSENFIGIVPEGTIQGRASNMGGGA